MILGERPASSTVKVIEPLSIRRLIDESEYEASDAKELAENRNSKDETSCSGNEDGATNQDKEETKESDKSIRLSQDTDETSTHGRI